MTTADENILTSPNLLQSGEFLQILIDRKVLEPELRYRNLHVGDRNAIMIASRILGYGSEYTFEHNGEEHTVDLSQIESKPINEENFPKGVNDFSFTLPHSKINVTFKLLTSLDEKNIERELEGLKKINKDNSPELSTRMKHMITSINGNRETKTIREFVDKQLFVS